MPQEWLWLSFERVSALLINSCVIRSELIPEDLLFGQFQDMHSRVFEVILRHAAAEAPSSGLLQKLANYLEGSASRELELPSRRKFAPRLISACRKVLSKHTFSGLLQRASSFSKVGELGRLLISGLSKPDPTMRANGQTFATLFCGHSLVKLCLMALSRSSDTGEDATVRSRQVERRRSWASTTELEVCLLDSHSLSMRKA
ncbi:unnamed protein product [Arctogadus glacialis]